MFRLRNNKKEFLITLLSEAIFIIMHDVNFLESIIMIYLGMSSELQLMFQLLFLSQVRILLSDR